VTSAKISISRVWASTFCFVAEVISLEHVRRAQRLVALVVDRVGLDHFSDRASIPPRIDLEREDEALEMCADWIERRTGARVSGGTREVMRKQLRRHLILRMAEELVSLGY
jgi:hypothetical protein